MSHRKEIIALMKDERERKRKQQRLCEEASRQLYNEGEIGSCGATEDFWKQKKKINTRAHELEKRR